MGEDRLRVVPADELAVGAFEVVGEAVSREGRLRGACGGLADLVLQLGLEGKQVELFGGTEVLGEG